MSLPHAILGFLNVMPLTGYDLKTRAFDQSVAHFWPAVLPQIYRELEKMSGLGWVESEFEVQEGRPNRRVYSITPPGRAELGRWLRLKQPPAQPREPFLIRLFFAAGLSNAEIVALLDAQRQAHAERLAALEQIRIPPAPEGSPEARRHLLTGLTLDYGLRHARMHLEWLAAAARLVESMPEPKRKGPR